MYRIFLTTILALITCLSAIAQDVEVKITAPAKVGTGQPFRLELSVNSQNAQLSEPQLGNFNIHQRSSGTNMSIINGDMTVMRSYIYILSASKPGTYTIPAVKATVGNKEYKSNSVTIEVSGTAQSANGNQQPTDNQGNGSQPQSVPSESSEIFLDVHCNKTEAYIGEQVLASVSLYSQYQISDFQDFDIPKFEGFWVKDVENPKNVNLERTRINGKTYITAMLQKKALFPQKAGTLTISPYELDVVVGDGFFHRSLAKAKSKTKTIKVKPLPEGKPEGFSGAVGQYKISLTADKSEVNLDEPLTIKLTISGSGNIQLIEAPKIDISSAFEQFEPKTSEDIKASASGVSGSKTFSTVVIARQPGEYTIPGAKFSYFDPSSKSYKTIESKELTINITGERAEGTQSPVAVIGTEIEDLGSDIRFIKQEGIKLRKGIDNFFNTLNFWLTFILLIAAFAGILLWRLQQIKNEGNVIGIKKSKAGKTSRKRLKKAEQFIQDNKKNEFYVEVLNALWGYLSDKLSIPASELNRDNVKEKLAEKNIPDEVTSQFLSTLETCEFEHYAPESMSHPLQEVYQMAADAIEQMEGSIK